MDKCDVPYKMGKVYKTCIHAKGPRSSNGGKTTSMMEIYVVDETPERLKIVGPTN